MKKVLKKVITHTIAFVLGAIVFVMIGAYAASTLSSSSVYYDNSKSGGSSTNVAGAVNELYEMAETYCPDNYVCSTRNPSYHYAFGVPTTSSTTNHKDVVNSSGSRVFMKLEGTQYSMCIYVNNTLECFKNNNYTDEKQHMLNVFGTSNCVIYDTYIDCGMTGYACDIGSDGYIICSDVTSSGYVCEMNASGWMNCRAR